MARTPRTPLEFEVEMAKKLAKADEARAKAEAKPEPSAAEKAYKLAQAEIARAKSEGQERLDFTGKEYHALQRLPPEIAQLEVLRHLELKNKKITDITPLSGLTGLTELGLNHTGVVDVTPLESLTGLRLLWLSHTSVTDVTPLHGLTGLTDLWLSGTGVTDVTPLEGLTGLKLLWLDKTGVRDLRPLRGMTQLVEAPDFTGLRFKECAACALDPEIDRISKIEGDSERARVLFAYLEDWVPPGEAGTAPDESPDTPKPGIAPLQAEVIDGRLVRVGGHGLPQSDAMARAEAGWNALREFRKVFDSSCNVHNYGQLVAVLDGFDAAMGDRFEPDRLILIGTMGSAVVALSDDTEFCEMLPTGAAALLSAFGVQIETFLNRFPDWVTYQEEAMGFAVSVAQVAEERVAFEEIEAELRESEETDRDVVEDYSLQVNQGANPESSEAAAKGLVASTRETVRALSEAAVDGIRSGRFVREEVDALDKVHDTELAKVKWYAGGFAFVILRRRSVPLRRLASRFPGQLGWLHRVLDYLGAASVER